MLSKTHRILIVDPSSRQRQSVSTYLEKQGFQTLNASNATEMQKLLGRFDIHLIVMETILPETDGLSICKQLRVEGNNTPIIFISTLNEITDIVNGLNCGGDDYLVKPFEPRELLARVWSLLRRTADVVSEAYHASNIKFQFDGYLLDGQLRRLTYNNSHIPLTSDEFALLITLTSMPGKTFSRSHLAKLLTACTIDKSYHNIDTLVYRVRKRLRNYSDPHQYIQSVRGIGYVFIHSSTLAFNKEKSPFQNDNPSDSGFRIAPYSSLGTVTISPG